MSKVMEFQKLLLTDADARKQFAADPKAFLTEYGVELPKDLKLPATLDYATVDKQITAVAEGLKEDGVSLSKLDTSDSTAVINVIGDAVAVRTADLAAAKAVHSAIGGRNPGDVATVAVVGAVVAAVVAVPVATFGRTADWVTKINPAGIEKITRGQLGITVYGPNGLRLEGLSVNDAASLIRTLR
jgi:hypothetical protein